MTGAGILPWLPQLSDWAADVDALFWLMTAMTVVVMLSITFAMTFLLLRFRRARGREHVVRQTREHRLESLWTLLPLLVFVGFFLYGSRLYLSLARTPADAYEVYAVGKQWMWTFYHPQGITELNTLHVPKGRPIRVLLASEDVIHSLYVPALRLKHDAVPGRYTEMWFEARQAGDYRLVCAEYCGTKHSAMLGSLTVMEVDDYARWLAAFDPPETPLEDGRSLYAAYGCGDCHAGDSSVDAPALAGAYGRRVQLESGGSVRADENYLRRAILTPDAERIAGYDAHMPAFRGRLSEVDVAKLVAWLKSGAGEPL